MTQTGQSKWYVLWRMTWFEINIMLADQPQTISDDEDGNTQEDVKNVANDDELFSEIL